MAAVTFIVPAGCQAGDEVLVDVSEGEEMVVTVPAGAAPGEVASIDILEVVTPDGCSAGDEVLCCDQHGGTFYCIVPAGCVEGTSFTVAQPRAMPKIPATACSDSSSLEDSGDFSIDLALALKNAVLHDETPQCSSASSSPTNSSNYGPSTSPGVDSADETSFGPPCDGWSMGPSLLSSSPAPPKLLCVGLMVEVLRSDGRYTRGTIDATDADGLTYTVRLDDGRIKYLVEEEVSTSHRPSQACHLHAARERLVHAPTSAHARVLLFHPTRTGALVLTSLDCSQDLRHFRAGAFHVGDRVFVRLQSAVASGAAVGGSADTNPALQLATIAEFDDTSETYSVVMQHSGRRESFLTEDMIVSPCKA